MPRPLKTSIPLTWKGARCASLRITRSEEDLPFLEDCQDLMLDICNQPQPCPVRARCLLFALINNCQAGIWGGMTPEDRAALRKIYPLGAGRITATGVIYDPPAQWTWMPPGAAPRMLPAGHRRRPERGKNENGTRKTIRPDERTS